MYTDKKLSYKPLVAALAVLILAISVLCFFTFRNSGKDLESEGVANVKNTIQKSARQCYAVEGVYPSDLNYLIENYGLHVNTKDYYITYEVFAENVAPDVIVSRKKK